jgi:hypothetical protein
MAGECEQWSSQGMLASTVVRGKESELVTYIGRGNLRQE